MNVALESQNPLNPTYAYTGAFVDELQRAGVRNVVICPGSRSTPLAMSFAAQAGIHTWMHVDERSAGYFGLGMAKQLRQPVALLCSSGTAAANFLPAIVEARLTHVPLLVLTADRPHELRDDGAPQSIDQNRLYGVHVKWFAEVALPEATDAALRYIRTLAARASAVTRALPAGPVHLNFPFREPLTPEAIPGQPLPPVEERDPIAWQGRPGNIPYVAVSNAPAGKPTADTVARLASRLRAARRGLIIVGPNDDPALAESLVPLARQLGYPILADPLSQLRRGDHDQSLVLSSYDAFLRSAAFTDNAQPELVLRFGAMPTSKAVLLYLKRYATCPLVVIDAHDGWEEPTQLAAELIHANPAALCQQLLIALEQPGASGDGGGRGHPGRGKPRPYDIAARLAKPGIVGAGQAPPWVSPPPALGDGSQAWISTWLDAERITRQAIQAAIQDFNVFFEGRVFTELAHLLPGGTTLYVGNSMPVRDLDTFFWSDGEPADRAGGHVRILGNRGANGIDGVVSSALGASAGAGQANIVGAGLAPALAGGSTSTMLVLGDLSFFHDLNGLLAARLHRLNLTIVLINNDGGGIFSFLPQATYPQHFEQLFGTPTGLDFRLAVQMYGGQFDKAQSWEQFRKLVSRGLQAGGLHVIEVQTERASNVTMHHQLWEAVDKSLNAQDTGMDASN